MNTVEVLGMNSIVGFFPIEIVWPNGYVGQAA